MNIFVVCLLCDRVCSNGFSKKKKEIKSIQFCQLLTPRFVYYTDVGITETWNKINSPGKLIRIDVLKREIPEESSSVNWNEFWKKKNSDKHTRRRLIVAIKI